MNMEREEEKQGARYANAKGRRNRGSLLVQGLLLLMLVMNAWVGVATDLRAEPVVVSDDFDDGSLDSDIWSVQGATPIESNGALGMQVQNGEGSAVQTRQAFVGTEQDIVLTVAYSNLAASGESYVYLLMQSADGSMAYLLLQQQAASFYLFASSDSRSESIPISSTSGTLKMAYSPTSRTVEALIDEGDGWKPVGDGGDLAVNTADGARFTLGCQSGSDSSARVSFDDFHAEGGRYVPPKVRKGPYLIYPNVETSMTVLWQTADAATCTLRWGLDAACSSGSAAVSAYGDDFQYRHNIEGLEPGAKYYYRVQIDDELATGTFRSAPTPDAGSLAFLAYGDTRSYPDIQDAVCARMVEAYRAEPIYQTFLLHSGDWVNDGRLESAWQQEYFSRTWTNTLGLQAGLPVLGCVGNHEFGSRGTGTLFKKYWPYPYPSAMDHGWSFEYGPALFVIVDQYDKARLLDNNVISDGQLDRITGALANSTKKWKFLVLHEPGWSAGGTHPNNTDVQERLQPLCEFYGVQIVFCGHNHYYARCSVNGVQHITTGGGGAPLNALPDEGQPFVVTAARTYEFCKVRINEDLLFLEVRDLEDGILDAFTIPELAFQWEAIAPKQQAQRPFDVAIVATDPEGKILKGFDGKMELSGTIAKEIAIGEGTQTWGYPFFTDYQDARTQCIYLADEIATAGDLVSLALDLESAPQQPLSNWTIRMRHTSLDAYESAMWETEGWTTVYQADEVLQSAGWVTFHFSTPFAYNGTDNLMVDFSFNNDSHSPEGFCRYSATNGSRSLYYQSDSKNGDPLEWAGGDPAGKKTAKVPNIRLTTGSDVAIAPKTIGPFEAGVWRGRVTVLEEAQGLRLRADEAHGAVIFSNTLDVAAEQNQAGDMWILY